MYANNPYAQAGWYNPQNPYSINNRPWCPNSWHTPTFGVLPLRPNGPSSVLTFEFTSPLDALDVLNCIVIGPKQLKFFKIQTDSSIGSTTVSKPTEAFAKIQWNQYPTLSTIEAKCALPLQPAADFLRPSPDQISRTMLVGGKSYTWIACQSGTYLFNDGPTAPQEYARICFSNDAKKLLLEVTSEAFQAGIFEPCILAVILLFSSRPFD